jgi:hypothetical protein
VRVQQRRAPRGAAGEKFSSENLLVGESTSASTFASLKLGFGGHSPQVGLKIQLQPTEVIRRFFYFTISILIKTMINWIPTFVGMTEGASIELLGEE